MTSMTSNGRLILNKYEDIINASKTLSSQPEAAASVRVLCIDEVDEGTDAVDESEEEMDAVDEVDEESDTVKNQAKLNAIEKILIECSKHSSLEAFKWQTVSDKSFTRSAEFWQALDRTAPNLRHLSLNFHTHELHRMKNSLVAPSFPTHFPLLKSLYIDCSGAHGDDGAPIEKLLQNLPNLEVLHFDAPICDLESCRIQGLTWSYRFSKLTHLALSIYYQSAQDIASFLSNHPNIRTLMYHTEGDDPLPGATSLLPRLEALSVENWGQTTMLGYTELLKADTPRNLAYFKTGEFPHDQYHLIPEYAPSIRCLEVSLSIDDLRTEEKISESGQLHMLQALLALMPDLIELAIHFSSGWTSIFLDDGTSYTPVPMDEDILQIILMALPRPSKLQVLRMKDHDEGRANELDFDKCKSLREHIPNTLKTLQWEIQKSKLQHSIEAGTITTSSDRCSAGQEWPDSLLWTDASVIKHLRV